MIFLMIVPGIMIVAVVLVHEVSRFFDAEISYIPLVLCAVLSFVVDIVAVELSTAPGLEYFLKLLAISLVAAAVVTVIDFILEVKR